MNTELERRLFDLLLGIADPVRPHPELAAPVARSELLKPAAVLIPIVVGATDIQVILTVRNANLNSHPGQISFPGGRVEKTDASVADTAMREAHEELGLEPRAVRIIGSLTPCITGTGYKVVPVVGLVPPAYPYLPDENEVAEIFAAPLRHLLTPENHARCSAMFQGQRREYYEILYGNYRIWGATAQMIVDLYGRLAVEPHYSALKQLII